MIICTIELKSARGEKHDRPLGVITIANDGTSDDPKYGNYKYAISHAGIYFGKRKEPFKKGKVKGFKRTLSPYRLVYRCLKDAGEV
jgi:hypothetical protein